MRAARFYIGVLSFLVGLFCLHLKINPAVSAQPEEPSKQEEQALLQRVTEPYSGDLAQIKKRRLLRVLVNYSKTNFFFAREKLHGFEYELLKTYEKFLNKNIKRRSAKIKMFFVPVPFDRIFAALKAGHGDIGAAGLTITPERQALANFTRPYIADVHEVVVLNKDVKGIRTLKDLSGRMIYVRSGSSYVTHLKAFNQKMASTGRAPVKIKETAQYIVTEDILELINAGILKITVADQHIAEAWTPVLPDIVIRKDLKINTGGQIAWAVRKENPRLLDSLKEKGVTIRVEPAKGMNPFVQFLISLLPWIHSYQFFHSFIYFFLWVLIR